jgi:AraC-type DNA-binding domain-containing proteins
MEFDLDAEFPVIIYKHLYSPNSYLEMSHYHNCLEIGYCYEGEGLFFIEKKVFSFSKGDVSVIFPNQVHIAKSARENKSNWRFLLIDPEKLFRNSFSEYWKEIVLGTKGMECFPGILTAHAHQQVVDMVFMLFENLLAEEEHYKMVTKGLMLALLAKISGIIMEGEEPDANGKASKSDSGFILKIVPALNYISKNYAKEISSEYLAMLCNTSVTSFRRYFHRAMGISPMEYIHKARMQMAKVLLDSTDDKILEIALSIGYESISSFNRNFLKTTGVSPRQWRRAKSVNIRLNVCHPTCSIDCPIR